MTKASFVYVTYIHATPEKVWQALSDRNVTREYWGHENVSDWKVGSRWEHRRTDADGTNDGGGTVVESVPPKRLVLTWCPPAGKPGNESRVTFTIEAKDGFVRLTVLHEDLAEKDLVDVSGGWPAVLSNLKTFLETGKALPKDPWL